MAITYTSTITDSIAALYEKDFLEEKRKTSVWAQDGLVNWKYALGGANLRGSSINIPMIQEMLLATTALTETSDVTPVALADTVCTVSFAEYGNVVQSTRLLDIESYPDLGKMSAFAVAQNQAKTIDAIVRTAAVGGTWVGYVAGVGTRTGLDTTSDLVTFADLMLAKALVQDASVTGFGNDYVCIVHPLVLATLSADTSFLSADAYKSNSPMMFNGEVGKCAGFRFISHEYGKLYLSGGSTAQAASTLSAAISAGDTTCTITTSTGIVAGDYITVGTLETAGTEQVLVVSINATSTATIIGRGNTASNFGFKYAHDNGAAVTDSANVAGMVIAGRNSLFGAYAKDIGKDGRQSIEWAKTNIPERFLNHSWYWLGGVGRNEHALLRFECAVNGGILGDNMLK